MTYKNFTIRTISVLTGDVSETDYTITGSKPAYQIIEPITQQILGIFISEARAKKAIDKNGERWLKR